jgi:hypothetical protein
VKAVAKAEMIGLIVAVGRATMLIAITSFQGWAARLGTSQVRRFLLF